MKNLVVILALITALPVFANINLDYQDGVYHAILDGKKSGKKIDFVSVEGLETNKNVHNKLKSKFTINTGFFDPQNKKTISYISSKFSGYEDPLTNENLLSNPVLNKNIQKILNRTEFRVLECESGFSYEITPHSTPIKDGCLLLTSAQGGPEIYPELRLEEEFFIVKDKQGNIIRESCSVLHKTARTIIALKDNNIHIFIITTKKPMTLQEAADYVKSFGVEKAMAFDGGSSTSLNYKDINITSTQSEGEDTGRKLKSFMIYK